MLIWKVIILVSKFILTFHHYISPPDPCLQAQFCNHTWNVECGIESTDTDKRLFLDLCDMFEYNCDYGKEYSRIDLSACHQNCTSSTTAMIPRTSNHTTLSLNSNTRVVTTETIMATLSTTENEVNETDKRTSLFENTTTVLTTRNEINTTNQSTAPILLATEVFENTEYILSTTTETNYLKLDTTDDHTTEKNIVTVTSTTIMVTTVEDTNNNFVHTLTPTSLVTAEVPLSTKILSDATTELNNITINENTIQYDRNKTVLESSNNENIIPSISPNVTCSAYPQVCARPKIWETTAEGERRDFFQILRDRFDNNIADSENATI